MFNKTKERFAIDEVEAVIGPSVRVKGNFSAKGNLIVEGVFEGSIKTASALLVGDQAKITAGVEAREAKIAGEVIGNIKINDRLEILSTAKIIGDIECNALSIEDGAYFQGKCTMQPPKTSDSTKKDKTKE